MLVATPRSSRRTLPITLPATLASVHRGHGPCLNRLERSDFVLWVRPDYRGTGLAQILSPLVRYYGLSQWDIDFEFMVGSKAFLQPEIRDMYQCQHVQEHFSFKRHGVTLMEGPLIWSEAEFILDRLGGAVADLGGIGSREVGAGREYKPLARAGRDGNE